MLIHILFALNPSGLFNGAVSFFTLILKRYGYLAIFLLMVLEAASLPIPSEVVLPAAGLLAATGLFNIYLIFIVITIASLIGITIDYYLAYFIEKEIIYKHLKIFRISRKQLEGFDRWFNRNGPFTVFIGRMLPEIRGLVSLPAGFAKMPLKKFYSYSLLGITIWDIALLAFGYYALNAHNAYVAMVAVAVFATVIYALFRIFVKNKMD
jgi:membrane protein DedA with SNARE-associated domain